MAKRTITERRKVLGLTQKRLGELAGIDQPTVSRAEAGRAPEAQSALQAALDRVEAERAERKRRAAAFWADLPAEHRAAAAEIVSTIAGVSKVLRASDLSCVELGHQLAECLPAGRA